MVGGQEVTTVVRSEAATQTQIRSGGEMDTIAKTAPVKQRRHQDVNLETRAYFDNFMAISDETTRPRYETQESLGLGLDFSCTDIEADGGSTSSLRVDESEHCDETISAGNTVSSPESSQTTGEDRLRQGYSPVEETQQDRFRRGGMKLREIADGIDREFFQRNSTANEVLDGFIRQKLQQTADKAFEHTIEQVLEEFNGRFPQHDDKHQVVLVMLCTRRTIITINSALGATRDTSERIIGTAMSYIADHYPSWIDNFR